MGQQLLPPGFRFSPTDDELVSYYLRSKALGRNFHQAAITDVDVYKFEPWDLPGKSALPSKDQEWYFFSAQDKKYSHTARINRTTKKGYWKATGKDRKVSGGSSVVGLKKTLIYYEGRAPNGRRTNWIMHEYRLDEEFEKKENIVSVVVLCRIRKKGGPGPRNGEQYGAPIMAESVDLEEEANTGRIDDDVKIGQSVVESKGGGNVFNLRDQVEAWKQMGSSNMAFDHVVIKEEKETGFSKVASDGDDLEDVGNGKGMIECDADLCAYFPSISDTAYSDMAPSSYKHGGDTFPCYHECLDTQNPGLFSELDALPFLPTFWDAAGLFLQDITVPAVDESEIIREMSDRINDSKAVVGGTGSMMQPAASNVPLDGDYIGLEDLEAPFDGFTSRPSIHSSGRGKFERQQLWFRPDTNVETYGEFQDPLHSKGPAAHGAGLPIRASKGGLKAANNVLSQEEKFFYGGNMSIPISRENFRDAGKNYPGSTSGAGDPRHVMESSTRSYLSKHVSTYAVSKHEMLPAQLCYASVTDGQDCVVTVKSPTASSTDFAVQGKCNVDADAFGKLPTTLIDLPSSSSLLTKNSKNIDTDALKRTPATPIYSSLSPSPPMKSTSSEGRHTNVKVPSASQTHDPRSEHANMSSSSRHRWKTPFRGLVSKAKQSALGTKLIELENGMRAKFNDKLSVLGKPAARFFPTRGSASLYDSLMQGLVATLFRLVAAVLSFLCLFWGFRVLVNYAFSVSV